MKSLRHGHIQCEGLIQRRSWWVPLPFLHHIRLSLFPDSAIMSVHMSTYMQCSFIITEQDILHQIFIFHSFYSVFLFLWRAIYKLSSEAGNGEVINPKQSVRERDRKSPTAFHKLHVRLYWVEYLTLGNGNIAICRAKFLARVSHFRRHR